MDNLIVVWGQLSPMVHGIETIGRYDIEIIMDNA
jgi:hypothetical protein